MLESLESPVLEVLEALSSLPSPVLDLPSLPGGLEEAARTIFANQNININLTAAQLSVALAILGERSLQRSRKRLNVSQNLVFSKWFGGDCP